MAFSNISVLLATNAAQFKGEMAVAGAAAYGLGKSVHSAMTTVQSAGTALAASAAAVGATVAGIAAIAVNAAMNLETAMNNVATVWDEAGQKAEGTFLGLEDAGQKVIDLSTKLPQSATALAEGLYDVASSGFQGTEAITVLTSAAKAGSAGLTDTATAGRAITAVLNSYGLSASEAGSVSDTMFQIVNKGVTTFGDLAQNMGQIAPLASAAGVSFADAGAAFAAMTLAGLPAAEAATSLSGVIRGLVDPSKEMSAQLAELGYESGTAALNALGLKGTLDLLLGATQGQSSAWVALFPDIRAATGAMAATSDEGKVLAEVSDGVADSIGATDKALAKQSESLSFQMTAMKNGVTALAIEFGQALMPAVKLVAEVVASFISVMNSMPDILKQVLFVGAGLIIALATLGVLFGVHYVKGLLMAKAWELAGAAATKLGVSTKFASAAMTGMQVAAGALGGVTAALMILEVQMAKAEERAKGLVAALSKDIDLASYEGTEEQIRKNEAALEAANQKNEKYTKGIFQYSNAILGGIVQALPGVKDEIANIDAEQTAYNKTIDEASGRQAIYNDNVNTYAAQNRLTRTQVIELAKAHKIDLYGGATVVQKGLKDAAYAMSAEGKAAAAAAADTAALADVLKKMFDPTAAYKKGLEAVESGEKAHTSKVEEATSRRHDVEDAALDERHRLQDAALDKLGKARESALDRQHKVEDEALEAEGTARKKAHDLKFRDLIAAQEREFRAQDQALDKRIENEENALDEELKAKERAQDLEFRSQQQAQDREFRAQEDALDRQLRAEQDALDVRLGLLDDEYEKRAKAEDRRWAAEQDDINAQINSTFGAERESWKEKLIIQEGAHDDIVNGLDAAQAAEENVLQNGLDDQHTILKNGLADQHTTQKNALADQQATLKTALIDRYAVLETALAEEHQALKDGLADQQATWKQGLLDRQGVEAAALAVELADLKAALTNRQTAQQAALTEELRILGVELDKQQARAKTAQTNRQTDENAAADARRTASAGKHTLTLAQLQTQLDDEKKLYDKFNADLAIIASRGGSDVMSQVALLDPAIVAQAARAGPAQLTALLESIRQGMARTGTLPSVPTRIFGNAQGAIFYAAGGGVENHVAQIAPAGSWRVWAEPETGGEAYIPLARSKRSRSTSILAEVAEHFGGALFMANGGIVGGSARGDGGVTVSMPIDVRVSAAVGADANHLSSLIASKVEAGVGAALDHLGRQVTVKAWRR